MTTATLESIKGQAKIFPPGILRPGQSVESHIGHTVINLSDITLSEQQTTELEKGLPFCPTPQYQPDLSKIWSDLREFQRKMELTRFFSEITTADSQISQTDKPDSRTEKFKITPTR